MLRNQGHHGRRPGLRPAILAALLALVACTAKSGFNGASTETSEKAPADGSTRPTDEGESLPGYLVDPAKIDVAPGDGGVLTITAPVGEVADAKGPKKAPVFVWQLPRDQFAQLFSSTSDVVTVRGTLLGSVTSAADGSLSGTVKGATGDPVFLTVTVSADGQTVQAKPGDGKHVLGATHDFIAAQATHGFRIAPQSQGWTPAEVQSFSDSYEADTHLSAAENKALDMCDTLAIAGKQTYDAAMAVPSPTSTATVAARAASAQGYDPCYELALTVGSDSPDAAKPNGKWTKREITWFVASCTDGSAWVDGKGLPLSQCTCDANDLSAKVPFLDYLSKNIGQSIDSFDPNVLNCQ